MRSDFPDKQRTTGSRAFLIGATLMATTILSSNASAGETDRRESLRTAIEHLSHSLGSGYPDGERYLAALDGLSGPSGEVFKALQREAQIANPLVGGRPILFVETPTVPG